MMRQEKADVLSDRQKVILDAVITDYIATATPVASARITREHRLGVSAATVRSEMAALERYEYVKQPHTSAGRVPTDKGYRYFVEYLMEEEDVPAVAQHLARRTDRPVADLRLWLEAAATALSETIHTAALVTTPRTTYCHVKALRVLTVTDEVALLVLVLEEGLVCQEMLPLHPTLRHADLEVTARTLSDRLSGLGEAEIEEVKGELSPAQRRVASTAQRLRRRLDRESEEMQVEGLGNLLEQPEFHEAEQLRRLLASREDLV